MPAARVKAVTLRYRPVQPMELYDNAGALAENYVLQTKVLRALQPISNDLEASDVRYHDTQKNQQVHDGIQELDKSSPFSPYNSQSQETNTTEQKSIYLDDEDDSIFDLLELEASQPTLKAVTTTTTTLPGALNIGDKVYLYAEYFGDQNTFTVGEITGVFGENAAVHLLAQRDPTFPDSPLFEHRGGMTLVIPLAQLKKWESNEEINYTNTADEYFHKQTSSMKTTENLRKRLNFTIVEFPSKKHASIITTEINYSPPGVTPLDISDADSREEFYEKWSGTTHIALGCLHTNGISNFRGLRVKVRRKHKVITENSELVGFGFYLDTGELYFLSTQNLQKIKSFKYNANSLFSALWVVDSIQSIDDPKLIAWVANTERDLSYNELLADYLQLEKRNENFPTLETAVCNSVEIFYSDLQYCIGLFQVVEVSLEASEINNYRAMEIPLCIQICKLQLKGILFDGSQLENYYKLVEEYLAALEAAACKLVGVEKINITSSSQIADLLFRKLGLPQEINTKKKKTPSTSKDALLLIADKHPVVPLILDHRTTRSLLSSQMKPLIKLWKSKNSSQERLKCSWHLTNSPTGRVTTTEPNFQAMRNQSCHFSFPDGREFSVNVRDCVKAPEGYSFVSFDYSQLEIRVLAHFCRDATLMEFLASGKDLHSLIASRWLKKAVEDVTAVERQNSKEICYGIIYGMSPFTLAQKCDCSMKEACLFANEFYKSFPGIKEFQQTAKDFCKTNGFVTTILGRRRHIQNGNETKILSSIIQGSASDIVNQGMLAVCKKLLEYFPPLDSQLVLQIHDEFLLECPNDEVPIIKEIVKECMEKSIEMEVSLPVNCKIGPTFGKLSK